MSERMRFIVAWESSEMTMAGLCRSYGVSRPTGYKWVERFMREGALGLQELNRAPRGHPNQVSGEVASRVVELRMEHPTWGPKKLKARLDRVLPEVRWPAVSTIGEILKRRGLVSPRKRRHRVPCQTEPFGAVDSPNAVWCADFKGWFRTKDGTRCDPLTISDAWSRCLLRCQAVPDMTHRSARGLFEAAFREYGLPAAIRTDNGEPFASVALEGLSRLSVWWLKLGIRPERIEPAHPEQNGRHERIHLTLKQDTATPPARTLRAQQRRFDEFREEYNRIRPHEALNMATPAAFYRSSPRPYPERFEEFDYGDMTTRRVELRGVFRWRRRKVYLTKVLEHETVGLDPIDERYWAVYFRDLRLGTFDSQGPRMLTAAEARRKGFDAGGRPLRYAPGPSPSPVKV